MTVGAPHAHPANKPPTWGARIAASDLRMEYATPRGRVRALDDVTLTVEHGGSVAIVGPSGCGKSTLLGILGGLEVPTAGEVRIGEHVVSAMPDQERAALRQRAFGFVFQADNLQPFLTVSENVGLQAVLAGISDEPPQRQALLDELDVRALGAPLSGSVVRWPAATGRRSASTRPRPKRGVGGRTDRCAR